jgi:hypothetical protein
MPLMGTPPAHAFTPPAGVPSAVAGMAPPMVTMPPIPSEARALVRDTALPPDLPPIPREFAQLREVAQPAYYEVRRVLILAP